MASDSSTHTPTLDNDDLETILSIARNEQSGRITRREAEVLVAAYRAHDGLVNALRDLVALREYGDEADVLRADMSGPDGPMIQWAEVEQRVWANARRALAALSGIKTTEGT